MIIPAYIIHEILEREKLQDDHLRQEHQVELPIQNFPDDYPADTDKNEIPSQRGVVILDYFN